ncbi:ALBINO3-like protein 1, chloroplastic [Daucus carota subsp. sativus]|uniref:Membrane insertase YidC/Oxa/ALB C-terminal domain-containing protein n=1 Tax=Daucus carota subsp. sativus TaxID=79200 RepID=A0A166E7C6_DAUCS|nr:PREDICTED: ALBINO3-like protein 1, chloroplastic [Daucus carota subsp. sativus]XP_017236629.1 PREDICTED: ALBINO3-like protein 1, chloroplastic [Daucus carota subsp. sativus]
MTSLLSFQPNPTLSPTTSLTRSAIRPFLPHRTRFGSFSPYRPSPRGTICVSQFGLGQLPDPETAQVLIKGLFGKAEGFLYTLADAAVTASPATTDPVTTSSKTSDWFSGISNYMETVLKVLKGGLSTVHAPYAYGFAIILLTVLVKAATFPLTKKQVESAMAMRSFQPKIKAIQQKYAGDQEKIQIETARLYKSAGINPLAGCLPTLATIPVWIGLYRALSNVADEGLLTEGFFWIPSLAGPTTVAARQNGSGISWLLPFIDGHPPLGWSDTFAYLVLPVLLVVSQYISVQVMQTSQSDDPNLKTSQAITKFLPLMIGYFALSVPSGLSLYWLTNNILSTAQQVYLQKLGGARNPASQFSDDSITKELLKDQISAIETTTTKVAIKEEKKQTPEGPRPGDRFKQLKEEEARKRKQREEEAMKADIVAEYNVSVTNGKLETKTNSVEFEDRKMESFHADALLATENSSINDNHSEEFKENQDISSRRTEDDENSSDRSFRKDDQQHLHKNLK